MMKKWVTMFSTAALSLLLLAGCGGGSDSEGNRRKISAQSWLS